MLWKPRLQNAAQWLYECCMGLVLGRKPPRAFTRAKRLAAGCDARQLGSFVCCGSVFAYGTAIAASNSFLPAAAACMILLSFAPRSGSNCNFWRRCAWFFCALQLSLCRWQCSGCIKVPRCCGYLRIAFFFCNHIRRFSALASRSGFGAAIVARRSGVLCSTVSADRSVPAASKFLAAAAASVIVLSFSA